MKNYCGECAHWDGPTKFGNNKYCDRDGKYYPNTKEACYSFVPRPDKGYHRAGIPWYIASAICEILGTDEAYRALRVTPKLRYINKEEKEGVYQEYDSIGPALALQLYEETPEFAQSILTSFLTPCADAIEADQEDEAFAIFENMIASLKSKFLPENNILDYINQKDDTRSRALV